VHLVEAPHSLDDYGYDNDTADLPRSGANHSDISPSTFLHLVCSLFNAAVIQCKCLFRLPENDLSTNDFLHACGLSPFLNRCDVYSIESKVELLSFLLPIGSRALLVVVT
jgi:hypothetical protein